MKKFTFMAVMAIAAATFVACGGNSLPKAKLANDVDTLSYAAGISEGSQLANQRDMGQLPIDSAYLNDFLKGLSEGYYANGNKQKEAYILGIGVGQYLANNRERLQSGLAQYDSTKTINIDNFLAGFVDNFYRNDTTVSPTKATEIQKAFWDKMQELRFSGNKQAGVDFLAENAKNDSVVTTESGLQYKVITEGHGATVGEGQQVKVEYEGRLIDGTVFDSSAKHGDEPVTFAPTGVIPGFGEALKMMPAGSEWEIYIPEELAYGKNGQYPSIEPYSALIFKVKVLDIVK